MRARFSALCAARVRFTGDRHVLFVASMRPKRRVCVTLFVLLVLFGAKIVLLDAAASPGQRYRICLAALHAAAISGGGALPIAIEVERIGDLAFPRAAPPMRADVIEDTGKWQGGWPPVGAAAGLSASYLASLRVVG
jgi:hypothetical protein